MRTAAATCCRSVDWGRWRIDSASSCGRVRAILESGDHLKALRRRGRAGYGSRGESDASGIMAYRRAAGVPASSMRQLNSSSRWRCLPRSLRANRWRRAVAEFPGHRRRGSRASQTCTGWATRHTFTRRAIPDGRDDGGMHVLEIRTRTVIRAPLPKQIGLRGSRGLKR